MKKILPYLPAIATAILLIVFLAAVRMKADGSNYKFVLGSGSDADTTPKS